MGMSVGFGHCAVEYSGHVWVVIPDRKDSGIQKLYSGTLRTYVQDLSSNLEMGRRVGFRHCMSGMSLVLPGLGDRKDSGIQALYSGTLETCP